MQNMTTQGGADAAAKYKLEERSPLFTEENLNVDCTNYLQSKDGNESTLLDFLRVICLCHDVTRVVNNDGKSFLTGPSQDELCLLEMAEKTGLVQFIDRNSAIFTIKVQGEIEEYKTIKYFDFTSARKMMTRVVQNVATGQVMVMSKGADSAIISRCISRLIPQERRAKKDQG